MSKKEGNEIEGFMGMVEIFPDDKIKENDNKKAKPSPGIKNRIADWFFLAFFTLVCVIFTVGAVLVGISYILFLFIPMIVALLIVMVPGIIQEFLLGIKNKFKK